MSIYTFIILLHVIGTVLGTGGATVAEVQINKALKDKQVSPDERALMHGTYFMIRIGMALIIASVFAMTWYHISQNNAAFLLSSKVLFKEFIFVIIIANAVAISRRWVPLWLGASISFTSWWTATILGVMGYVPYSFITFFTGYVVAVLVMAGILELIRKRMMRTA